jgi:hypothetical protein
MINESRSADGMTTGMGSVNAQCYFVYHKSLMKSSEIDPGLSGSKARRLAD